MKKRASNSICTQCFFFFVVHEKILLFSLISELIEIFHQPRSIVHISRTTHHVNYQLTNQFLVVNSSRIQSVSFFFSIFLWQEVIATFLCFICWTLHVIEFFIFERVEKLVIFLQTLKRQSENVNTCNSMILITVVIARCMGGGGAIVWWWFISADVFCCFLWMSSTTMILLTLINCLWLISNDAHRNAICVTHSVSFAQISLLFPL